MAENYICFLVPNSKILNNTLFLSELEKTAMLAEAIANNNYNRIVAFTSGSMIVTVGIKVSRNPLADLFANLSG